MILEIISIIDMGYVNEMIFDLLKGLIFGDFSADEWQKYFRETAHGIGIRSPPVEVIFRAVYFHSMSRITHRVLMQN